MAQTHLDLGRRERQLMEAVYRLGRASVSDVLAQLPDPPSYSSVRAMLGKLQRKGYLRQEQDGPRYIYTPALSRENARRTALKNLLDTFFNGSAEQAAVALLQMSDTTVPTTVLDRLHERVRRARKEGR
jgi:BlaI family transcriptional regulator, penicillinase repressor